MEAEESAATKTKEEIESEIEKAMLSRLDDFKQQADNLTLEGVRRVLEKDLGMERLSLDTHKKFIKQCLGKYYYGSEDKDTSKTEGKTAKDSVQPVKQESASGQTEDLQPADDLRNISPDLNENLESSPFLDGDKHVNLESGKSHIGSQQGNEINEDIIKKAMSKRAAYFRKNLKIISLVKVRRLLEEDLELEKKSLDTYKNFISSEMDTILESAETVPAKKESKKEIKKTQNGKASGKTSKASKRAIVDLDDSDSENVSSGNDEEDEEIRKPKKRPAQKVKEDTKSLKRQKISSGKSKASNAAKKKPVESDSEKSGEGDGGKSSEDDSPGSSDDHRKVSKKSEKPAQVYGKQVEHLKSIIKSCGMGIPPSIYKRVKQAPESKREAQLIKELEEILEKEGLSSNPSEKDIKAVKKMKERAKELEGIDMSNIVSSSRRRSTSSYIPPPKPKIEVESDGSEEGEEDEEDEENDDGSDEGNNDGEDSSEGSDQDDAAEESD